MKNDKKIVRFFLDTEFNEHARKLAIDPISLALVAENPQQPEFYAVSNEYDESKITPWIKDNVIIHLPPPDTRISNDTIRDGIAAYFANFAKEKPDRIEIWASNGSTDNVVLANFFGGLMGLRQAFHDAGLPSPVFRELREVTRPTRTRHPKPENAHDALADARWTRDAFLASRQRLKKSQLFLVE